MHILLIFRPCQDFVSDDTEKNFMCTKVGRFDREPRANEKEAQKPALSIFTTDLAGTR